MSDNETIKDTLDVIRRALEDENDFSQNNENILILNKKVNEDGTFKLLNQPYDFKEINKIIDKKLGNLVDQKMGNILEKQLPTILDNYFKNKN